LLCSVDTRAAGFSRRQPEGFPVERLNALRSVGRLETGHGAEPRVQGWDAQGSAPWLRRIQAKLDQATRDGERGLYLLPPLPLRKASAKRVARFYRQRWPLETAFQPLEAYCHAAINSRATTLIMSGGSIRRWDSGHRQQYLAIQTYRGLSSLLLFICLDEILLANSWDRSKGFYRGERL
jgi:hypothetical protein